jgi:transcriptional regulator with XRE-family HTH domain
MRTNLPRAVRALRLRRGWRQADLAARAGLSRSAISRIERGQLDGVLIGNVARLAGALGASADLQLRWRGAELDRLVDARHASLQNHVADMLSHAGWTVRAEVSFNHYGDRGRVDLLAYHFALRIVLVVEIKSGIGDLQETLGRLDIKARLAPVLARQAGWADASSAVVALVIGDSRAARRIVDAHLALLHGFPLRGRAASAWLRRSRVPPPRGLLWFVNAANARGVRFIDAQRSRKRPDSHLA